MSAPEVHQLATGIPITCHAFNKDRTQVAVSPNNNDVEIYQKNRAGGWDLLHTLAKHDKLVTSIDWAPNTNRLVTCSQDRNAYVWDWDAKLGRWEASLCLLRINRAATFVKWSPKENKFAVASGARLISVCYFEVENNWWVAKHIKKPIRSTVTSVDWHPDNILLAAGSTDMKARVFSAYVKGVDAQIPAPVWGEKLPFNTVCGEFSSASGAWVHSVAFSPSGNYVAFASHDSTVAIANGPNNPVVTIPTGGLPLVSIIFTSETSIVGVGHDCTPYLLAERNGQWEVVGKLDQGQKKAAAASSAFKMFQQMDSRAQQSAPKVELNTTHQNTITCVRPHTGASDSVSKFSTSGVDGKLVIWDLLSSGLAGLKI
ncbi:WD40-repeat-containing domain protein [Fimicolochytrium jonesii]|uniref:WD40-repeat-containing domain protein n=1 Tax=Fimicolochytrium jonesii TaxID=1396493 RepID=UPI0022FE8969|nr:WD40-repeat-containing domain protein [Fimicolochytrium jonesii]KAI8826840.1 WD40-repeat-containing domain protein [Fimicolochytrium jonesii]